MMDYLVMSALAAGTACLYRIARNTECLKAHGVKNEIPQDIKFMLAEVNTKIAVIQHTLNIDKQHQESNDIITADKLIQLAIKIEDLQRNIDIGNADRAQDIHIGLDKLKKELMGKTKIAEIPVKLVSGEGDEPVVAEAKFISLPPTNRAGRYPQIKEQKKLLKDHPAFKGTEPLTSEETQAMFGLSQGLFSNRLSIKKIKLNRYRVGLRVYFRLDDVEAEVRRLEGGFSRSIK